MKKGLFIGLAAAMLLTLPVLADDAVLNVSGKALEDGKALLNNGETVVGEPSDSGYAYYKDGVLTLNGFQYTTTGENGKNVDLFHSSGDLTVLLIGENTLTGTEAAQKKKVDAFETVGNLTFEGTGTLTVDTFYCGIYSTDGNVMISGGTYNLKNIADNGIKSGDFNVWYEEISGGDISIIGSNVKIESGDNCIYVYNGDITIENSILNLETEKDRDGYGIYNAYTKSDGASITITKSDITLYSDEECIEALNGITIIDSTLRLTSDDEDTIRSTYEDIRIINSKLTLESYNDEGIDADDGDITIENSTVSIKTTNTDGNDEAIEADYDITILNSVISIIGETDADKAIVSENGYIIIDGSKITVSSYEDCIYASDDIVITNSSLDLTSRSGDCIIYSYYGIISLDSKIILYGENGKRLTNTPIAYSDDLYVYEEIYDGETHMEYNGYWKYNNQRVYRIVTAGDATEYIEKTFRSMKTVTFSGDGASALSGLWRAFGSTINLTKITPEAREGYTFTGWYADPACTKPITKLVVTGDMELYAGWEEIAVEEEEEATEAPAEEAAAE